MQPGSKAPMAAYHRQEMRDLVEGLIVMQCSVEAVVYISMLFWYRGLPRAVQWGDLVCGF